MADTFSNDLRVRLQESGSNAGSWGDLLNGTITNLASALGQGSEAIPNASTHTITLADGTADEARSLYLKCTGGGQACTVTLGPNTISKVWIIDNATSYTLTFSQGSGANVAIAAGAVKVIATDGAGSGAAVVDTLDGLEGSLSTLAVTGTATAGSLLTTGAIASTAVDGTVVDRSGNTSRFVAGRSGGNYAGLEMHVAGASGVTKRFSIDYDSTTKLFAPNGTSEHLVVTSAGDLLVGGTSLNAASSVGFTAAGQIRQVFASGVANDSLFGAISGVSNGFQIVQDASNNQSYIFHNGGAASLKIDSLGNLGVGVSPSTNFKGHFQGDAAAAALSVGIRNTNSTGLSRFILGNDVGLSRMTIGYNGSSYSGGFGASTGFIGMEGSEPLVFMTSGSERTRITGSGAFLVGKTSDNVDSGDGVRIDPDGAMYSSLGSGNAGYYIRSGGAWNFYVLATGQIYSKFNSIQLISDERLKENVRDCEGLEKVLQLQPRKFDWKAGHGKDIADDRGFIAQELEQVFPELVGEFKEPLDDDAITYKTVSQDLIPVMVKAIQELKEELNTATARITELENK